MSRILIIEDELPMRRALEDALSTEGHRVLSAADGETGLRRALEEKPDLLLLDVMMPKLDGLSLCLSLRRQKVETPVLMLTARGGVDERVAGLDAGADDYLVKPFSTRELMARVRALLRRVERSGPAPELLQLGEVSIDLDKETAQRAGQPLLLSGREFAMLRLLSRHAGRTVTREQFLDAVWGSNAYPTTRTVDNFISALRGRIEPDPKRPRYLITVHGLGYKLEPAA